MLTILAGLADLIHELAKCWYHLVDWLPLPLQVLSFIGVTYLAARTSFTHGLPLVAPEIGRVCRLALRALAWVFVFPEFLITSRALRTSGTMPPGVHLYGEAVAGVLEAGDRVVTALCSWVSESPRVANAGAVWVMVGAVFFVNAIAYRTGTPLPLALWWDSAMSWAGLPS